jgi:predicted permease
MGWIRRARALFRRDELSVDLDDELQFHLAMRERLNAAKGMSSSEARSDARIRFGNAALLKEHMREADLLTFAESIGRDLQYAARMLTKHPGFTVLAVLALAVGIGINTAVFTAYKAFILRPLDAENPRELVNFYHTRPEHSYDPDFSYPDFEGQRDRNRSFSGILAVSEDRLAMTEAGSAQNSGQAIGSSLIASLGFRMPTLMGGGAEYVSTALVSENYFSVLGARAFRGRAFLQRDAHELDLNPQVLISANYWQRRFGGDTSILGKSLKLNGVAFAVIGVTPEDFIGTFITGAPDFWLPLRLVPLVHHGSDILNNREKPCCTLFGRLAPGVTLAQAQAETDVVANQLRVLHPPGAEGSKPLTIQLTPGSPFHRQEENPKLKWTVAVMLGAVGLVLLIACANVAGMQLARSAARQREIGVRLSLGASRGRLIRQLLTESALLGLLAGSISVFMAWTTLRLLLVQAAAAMPLGWGTFVLRVEPDLGVFAYVSVISIFASVLFGLAPALDSSRPNLTSALKEEGSHFAFRLGNRRMRDIFMGVQVAVCLFLLVVAALLIHSSSRALDLETGYETKRVVELDVNYPAAFDYTHPKQIAEVRQLTQSLMSLAGVTGVTVGRSPDGGGLRAAKVILDARNGAAASSSHTLFYTFVLPNYFETLGIPFAAGYAWDEHSGAADSGVVLSESAARSLWPGQNAIGRTITLDISGEFHVDGEVAPRRHPYLVSGVVKETRGVLLDGTDSQQVYLPLPLDRLDEPPILVRTLSNPKPLINAIGRIVRAVDPGLVVDAITLDDALRGSPVFVLSRISGLFATLIGLLGLLLASVGIYGSVSYAVVRRTREVGIRVALGAAKGDVLRLVLRETARPVLIGLFAGLAMAVGAARLLRAVLNGLSVLDPVAFVGVSAFFLLIALVAACVPAMKALRIDPIAALRCE